MNFESEADLVDAFENDLAKEFGGDHRYEVREFGYGGGYTDLVVARLSPKYLARRVEELGLDIPIDGVSRLEAFLKLHRRGPVTMDYFVENVLDKGKEVVNWLLRRGFIEETSDKIRTVPNLRKHITASYAFEFKLKDWQKALEQAFRAKSYSNHQYVVMDGGCSIPAEENLDQFEKYNVGLITCKGDDFAIRVESEAQAPSTPVSEWALNEKTLR